MNVSDDRQRDDDSVGIDLTPMLDVVFIMLIFFIVTASFVKQAGAEVQRPQAVVPQPQDRVSILVAITADDVVWIDGRSVDIRDLPVQLARLHAENPHGSVVIQADRDSSYRALREVLDGVRRAGVTQVALAADRKE